jgi:ABC-type phosphonate transport system ATPase subunit
MENEGTELVDVYGSSYQDLIQLYMALMTRLSLQVHRCRWVIVPESVLKSIGEAGTGKSCLLYHCLNDSCTSERKHAVLIPVKENSSHTIGVEFSSRTLRIGERNIKLQVHSFKRWVRTSR